jgi:hypothetical protein
VSRLGADLNFIAPAEINTAVAAFRTIHFNVELKILEFGQGLDVGRTGSANAGRFRVVVHKFAVTGNPFVVGDVTDGLPASEVFSVKQGLRLGPIFRHRAVELRRPDADESWSGSVTAFFDACKLVGGNGGDFPADGRPATGSGDAYDQLTRFGAGAHDRSPRAASRLHATFNFPVILREFHPLGVGVSGARSDCHIPTAEVWFHVLGKNRPRQDCDG